MLSTAMMLLAAVLVVGTLAANIQTEDGTLTLVVDQGQEPVQDCVLRAMLAGTTSGRAPRGDSTCGRGSRWAPRMHACGSLPRPQAPFLLCETDA